LAEMASPNPETFGRRLLGQLPEAVLQLERKHPTEPMFRGIDSITNRLVRASLGGQRVVELREDKPHDILTLLELSEKERSDISSHFALEVQQSRGAWFLPEEARVAVGLANLGQYLARYPRFAIGVAYGQIGKVSFRSSPESLYFWAVLEPLFSTLFRAFELRGPSPAKGNPDVQKAIWDEVRQGYAALGLDVESKLRVFRYGGGWGLLAASEQLSARKALLEKLCERAHDDIAARFRIWRSEELIEKYYAKAKRSKPEMRKVLTKPLQRILAGCFAGDWSAFLRYLGEDLAPAEEIPTSLPETRLSISMGSDKPIQPRLEVMRIFWREFDSIHAAQAPGMPSLWGFVEESDAFSLAELTGERSGPKWFQPESYRGRLPREMLCSIDDLWNGTFLPRYPEGIATTVNPYARMCETFGPALRFWHGAALTAWFVSEGPYSRTDMDGLVAYYDRDLKEMKELGCPVDPALFQELIAAEKKLGKPQPFKEKNEDDEASYGGIIVSLSVSSGCRRSGFERLRDVLTRHRRPWAEQNLESYLRARWETELRVAADEYGKFVNVKGKPPTLKQFAKFAEDPTNHWFGGDVGQLYAALGKDLPAVAPRVRLLPRSLNDFALRVFAAVGGKPTRWEDLAATIKGDDRTQQDAAWRDHGNRQKLAELSISYVQLWEALGRPPSLKEFGTGKFNYLAATLDPDLERAWNQYASAIQACFTS
jgi:hypothetical protein